MSDQQEVSSEFGSSADGPQQQQQVRVEGLDSMKVKVTNIVDGFFRFASSRSMSSGGDSFRSFRSLSDSGRSSPVPSNASAAPAPIPTPATSSIKPKPLRRPSTKKVKFKEDQTIDPKPNKDDQDNDTDTPDTNDSHSARPMEPLNAENEAAKFYMDESSWGVPHARARLSDESALKRFEERRRDLLARSQKDSESGSFRVSSSSPNRKRSASSKDKTSDDMDGSTSTHSSWNVHLTESGDDGTEMRIKTASSFEAAGIIAKPPDTGYLDSGNSENNPEEIKPKWFEKYMPYWVLVIRNFCGVIVLDDRFQIIMVLLICANAIVMGVGTFDFVTDNPEIQHTFEQIDFVFLCIFTVELALQFGYWGYQVFTDGWLLFDVFTIVSSWLLDGVQVFRSFRVFRAFRLVVRIPILKSLVYAVFHVLPRITSIMGLFALLTYIYAVMATTLYKDYYPDKTSENYFGRLDYSLFTLFQFVTLEGWADIVRMYAEHDYFAYFIFGSFLTISGFILYSLVVAVVCDSFLMVETQIRAELKQKAKEKREKRKQLKRISARRNLNAMQDISTTNFENSSNPDLATMDESNPDSAMDESDPDLLDLDKSLAVERSRLNRTNSRGKPRFMRGKKDQPKPPPTATQKRGVPPPLAGTKFAHYNPELHAPRDDHDDELTDDDEDNSLPFQDTTSPTSTTHTTTLASGELERKKRDPSKQRKRKPVRQRIKRVRNRLDKLTAAQSEILSALDDMCKEMERRNGIVDK